MFEKATTKGTEDFWEGKASAMNAARKGADEARIRGDYIAAESSLASAHYSRAGTFKARGLWWLPLIFWHFWRARMHVRNLISYDIKNLSPDELDVAATILRKGPFPSNGDAWLCLLTGILKMEENGSAPHTAALLYIGFGEVYQQYGLVDSAHEAFRKAVLLIPRIEAEEPDLNGKRQLVRVLKACGAFFRRVDDSRGEEYFRRAEELAREVSPDQLAKIKAGL